MSYSYILPFLMRNSTVFFYKILNNLIYNNAEYPHILKEYFPLMRLPGRFHSLFVVSMFLKQICHRSTRSDVRLGVVTCVLLF